MNMTKLIIGLNKNKKNIRIYERSLGVNLEKYNLYINGETYDMEGSLPGATELIRYEGKNYEVKARSDSGKGPRYFIVNPTERTE